MTKANLISAMLVAVSFVTPDVVIAQESESRLVPLQSSPRLFDGAGIGFGLFSETTQYRAARRYVSQGLGLSLSYLQRVSQDWSGAIQFRWSEWIARKDRSVFEETPSSTVAPASIYSKVEYSPGFYGALGELENFVRPFITGGLGYAQFYKKQGLPTGRDERERSDLMFTGGGGIKFAWTAGAGVRLSWERWRSMRTFDYSAHIWQAELVLGDVVGW